MFDRCSSNQQPPESGHVTHFQSASHFSDQNGPNEPAFYRENTGFYQNYHQDYSQDYSQDFSQSSRPYQGSQSQSQSQSSAPYQGFQSQSSGPYQGSQSQSLGPYQESSYLQNRPHFFQQDFTNPQPQDGQMFAERPQSTHLHQSLEFNVYNNNYPQREEPHGPQGQGQGQFYSGQTQNTRFSGQQIKTEYQQFHQMQPRETTQHEPPPSAAAQVPPEKKKRGRPSKKNLDSADPQHETETVTKKRSLNRFDGLSVEEVMSRTLPDVIEPHLDILIIGINPGLMSAYKGHHYPNPGNHFWKCLFLSGLTEKQLNYLNDQSLPQDYGIGFTNMVERTTPGSKDLSSKEIREGGKQLLEKLQKYRPLIAAFNGKGIYESFCKETFGVKAKNLEFGLQPYKIPHTETVCFLMPSSSPRCAQFPRAQDKVHFYIKLKELRDQLKGAAPSRDVEETQYSFDLQLAKEDAKRLAIKEEQEDPEYESCAGVRDSQMFS